MKDSRKDPRGHAHSPPADTPCALQVGAHPLAVYREYLPPPDLEPLVICAWTLKIRDGDQPHDQRVLPDGCADILWIGDARPIVVGPMTRSAPFTTEAGSIVIGVRFRPDATARVLGVPAHELADRRLPLDQLWNSPGVNDVCERL